MGDPLDFLVAATPERCVYTRTTTNGMTTANASMNRTDNRKIRTHLVPAKQFLRLLVPFSVLVSPGCLALSSCSRPSLWFVVVASSISPRLDSNWLDSSEISTSSS